ncbi:hypothetical protein BESB_034450 [Besnoitia besnoiti]|uniref:Uncharacterized protein n=1 Tax=Besnoitia besnoiti TaxID=94643 RepID=A0A2A9MMJ1_BESBE|nr:hypothetical protein BESB_034450 [Besnoitia besnoiti]PFH36987.1 hypothetical protein BESB_034450 [Besnoitia besnoiti]
MPALGGGSLIVLTALGPVLLKTSVPAGGAAAVGSLGVAPAALGAAAAGTAVAGGGKAAGVALISKGAAAALKGSGGFLSKATGTVVSVPRSSFAATTGEAAHVATHSAQITLVAAKTTGGTGAAGVAGGVAAGTASPPGASWHPPPAVVGPHHPAGAISSGASSAPHSHPHIGPRGTSSHARLHPPHAHGSAPANEGHLQGSRGYVGDGRSVNSSPYGAHGHGAPAVPASGPGTAGDGTASTSPGTGEAVGLDQSGGGDVAPPAGSREVAMITTIAGLSLLRWAAGQLCCGGRPKAREAAGTTKAGIRKWMTKRVSRWSRDEEVVVPLKNEDRLARRPCDSENGRRVGAVSGAGYTGYTEITAATGDKSSAIVLTRAGSDGGKESVDGINSHAESETTTSASGEDDSEKDPQNSLHEDAMPEQQVPVQTQEDPTSFQTFVYIRRRRGGRMANFL